MITKIKNSSFLKDTFITFAGQFIVLLTNFIINKMVAIYVGVSQFGVFNIAKRSATVLGFIVLLELGISVPRYFAMNKHINRERAYDYYQTGLLLMIIASGLAIILGIIFSNSISSLLFGSAKYSFLSLPMIIFAIGTCFTTFSFSAYRGAEYYYLYTVIQILIQIIDMIVIFIFRLDGVATILFFWGISNILLSIPFLGLFSFLNQFPILKKIKSFKKRIKELLIYGLPRIFGDVIQFSYYLLPLVIVNREFGKNSSGIFSASTGILQSFLPFFSYIGIILLPTVSKALVDRSLGEVKKQLKVLMLLYFAVSIIAVLAGFIFAKPIMIILYSSKYIRDLTIAKVLLITLVPRSQFLLLRNPIDAISVKPYNTWNLAISVLLMAVIIILADNILVIAWSFVLSDSLLFILSLITWHKLVNKELKENLNV